MTNRALILLSFLFSPSKNVREIFHWIASVCQYLENALFPRPRGNLPRNGKRKTKKTREEGGGVSVEMCLAWKSSGVGWLTFDNGRLLMACSRACHRMESCNTSSGFIAPVAAPTDLTPVFDTGQWNEFQFRFVKSTETSRCEKMRRRNERSTLERKQKYEEAESVYVHDCVQFYSQPGGSWG